MLVERFEPQGRRFTNFIIIIIKGPSSTAPETLHYVSLRSCLSLLSWCFTATETIRLIRDGNVVSSSSMVLNVHRDAKAYWGRGKNVTEKESPDPPLCSHGF